jgi:4-hydroxy-L-threonine phosphate dehydrogenase PdxA
MPTDTRPRIGLLFGDCTGIGPEIAAKVLAQGAVRDDARLVAIGDARVLELGMRDAGVKVGYRPVDEDAIVWSDGFVPLVDLGNVDPATIERGRVSAESGRLRCSRAAGSSRTSTSCSPICWATATTSRR